jgi:hypothetical protein
MQEIKNQYVDQVLDKGLKALHTKFHKFVPFNELLPIWENSYKIIQFNKVKKCLINIEKLGVHDQQSGEYINNVWTPRVVKEGVTHLAIVLPASAIGKMSSKKAHQSTVSINGLFVNNFSNEDEARQWLKSVN